MRHAADTLRFSRELILTHCFNQLYIMQQTIKKIIIFALIPLQKNTSFFVFMYILGIIVAYTQDALCLRLSAELLLELYCLCAIMSLLPSSVLRPVTGCISAFTYLIAIIDSICYHVTGNAISPLLLQLLLQTNTQETTEAIAAYISFESIMHAKYIICLMILNIMWCTCKKMRQVVNSLTADIKRYVNKLYASAGILAALIICIELSYPNLSGMYTFLTADTFRFQLLLPDACDNRLTIGFYQPIHRLLYSIKHTYVKQQTITDLYTRISQLNQHQTTIDTCTFTSPEIVLIIGESYNRHHSQLYGYSKETTPLQLNRKYQGQLTIFSDVITSWNYTSNSFEMLFSAFGYGDKGQWYEYNQFPSLLKNAGYNVTFLSNQFVVSTDNTSEFGDIYFNHPDISDIMFSHRNAKTMPYDEDLITYYKSIPEEKHSHNLTIFHLLGQHQAYNMRFPEKFRFFSPNNYDRPDLNRQQKQILADYDNATGYNDYVVDSIINLFETSESIVIYCPDHGEMCFDGNNKAGRTTVISQNTVYQQYEIPFWIWCSETYIEKHPDIANQIKQANNKRFMTDNISHLILYLAGIVCREYNPHDNIISPDYNEQRLRLMKGEIDYDSYMNNYSGPQL